jgi:hypothetical protein
MPNTWTASGQTIAFAANKHMLDVAQAAASTRFIRIYRAYAFNNQTTAIAGVVNTFRVNITAGASGGTPITPVAHNWNATNLNANTTCGTNRTIATPTIIRNLLQSPDEVSVNVSDWDALACMVPFSVVWDAGYADANIQPVTLRPGENRGFSLQSITQTVGSNDYEIMFTDDSV